MRKGQLLTIDFAFSLVVFLSIILILTSIWGSFDTQIRDVEARRDMQTLAVAVSDSLVRSPGYPVDWTNKTVQSIGLAGQERVLLLDKILKLNDMMDSVPPKSQAFDYNGARSILRLGGYEVMFYFKDYTGQNLTAGAARSPIAYYARNHTTERNAVADKLREYGSSSASKGEAVWDFYWGGAGGAGHGCNAYYCRYGYSDANPLVAFNMTVSNRSSYRTIIIEGMDLAEIGKTNNDLNITGLVGFVKNGGILIVIGGTGEPGAGIIDRDFGVYGVYNNTGWGDGDITNPGYFLRGMSIGGNVNWGSRDHWVFRANGTQALATYISRIGYPGDCMACSWKLGRGYIYYLEELNPILQDYAAIAGKRLNFGNDTRSGAVPVAASQMVTVKRTVIVDGFYRDLATMEVRVWKG